MTKTAVPTNAQELRELILERYDGMSKRLQQIARYVLDEPNELALETLAVIADRSGVQPSAIVRFAKSLGFEGASQMQRLFRDGLLSANAALGHSEKVRAFNKQVEARTEGDASHILAEFVEGNTLALDNLVRTVTEKELAAAIALIKEASTIYVAGFRRAFPVSSYLSYSLNRVNKRTMFIDGVAGLSRQQIQAIRPDDLFIAVAFHPYAEETVELVEQASALGAKVLAISDSMVSPIAKSAALVLQVRESEVRGVRSLAASICLAQALAIGFAFEVGGFELMTRQLGPNHVVGGSPPTE